MHSTVTKRKPKKLIIHSDQGSPYTSSDWKIICNRYNIKISMSRRGNSPDNGACETFFGTLKFECLSNYKKKELSEENTYRIIREYIEFYNYVRPNLRTQKTPYEIRMGL